ncbi:Htur_1727 family rSAM-partnered candidate RiPP [Haloglomus litoreum]|uniref:Htur_1727 family rSAM-partnered candidate RiPP n=1 Tax=Haloglomus litoreum TaxID=3034026 RepID=UPI0023E824BB|nr:Htur_1727 family rSAM-partnered candidate RiPP [Haloglomus sp. DT116]
MTDDGDAPAERSRSDTGTGWTAVDAPRSDGESEWELFLRESPTEPLRHAGSVTAPGAEAAHERATGLFPDATTLWCCPAGEVTRFTERDLGAAYREPGDGTTEGATNDGAADEGPGGETV